MEKEKESRSDHEKEKKKEGQEDEQTEDNNGSFIERDEDDSEDSEEYEEAEDTDDDDDDDEVEVVETEIEIDNIMGSLISEIDRLELEEQDQLLHMKEWNFAVRKYANVFLELLAALQKDKELIVAPASSNQFLSPNTAEQKENFKKHRRRGSSHESRKFSILAVLANELSPRSSSHLDKPSAKGTVMLADLLADFKDSQPSAAFSSFVSMLKGQLVAQTEKNGNLEGEGVVATATVNSTTTTTTATAAASSGGVRGGLLVPTTKQRKYIECNGLQYHSDMPKLDTSPHALSWKDYNPNHALWLSFCSVLVYRKLPFIEQCVFQVWGNMQAVHTEICLS